MDEEAMATINADGDSRTTGEVLLVQVGDAAALTLGGNGPGTENKRRVYC